MMVINIRKKAIIPVVTAVIFIIACMTISFFTRTVQPVDKSAVKTDVKASKAVTTVQVPAANSVHDFFAEYRMERDRVRSKEIDMLNGVVKTSNAEKSSQDAASLRLIQISADMEREMKAENLVKAQGCDDCVVISQSPVTTVILPAEQITAAKEQEIMRLLGRALKCEEGKLCIVLRKSK